MMLGTTQELQERKEALDTLRETILEFAEDIKSHNGQMDYGLIAVLEQHLAEFRALDKIRTVEGQ